MPLHTLYVALMNCIEMPGFGNVEFRIVAPFMHVWLLI